MKLGRCLIFKSVRPKIAWTCSGQSYQTVLKKAGFRMLKFHMAEAISFTILLIFSEGEKLVHKKAGDSVDEEMSEHTKEQKV